MVFAAICYAFQIYCDFSSYSLIALGLGKLLGFDLTENFRSPYFALSIQDFWRRWHISLSTWFRDYVYIPLGGNRCSSSRRNINLFITFLVSGMWHGANWTFLIWGALHGLYQIIGNLTSPFRKKIYRIFHCKTDCFSFRLGQRMCTFVLVTFAWIFFRAETISDAVHYIIRLFTKPDIWNLFNNSVYSLGLDLLQMNILFIMLTIIIILDYVQYKTARRIDCFLMSQNWGFQGMIYIILFIICFVFGMYGPAYNAQEFIYFQF